MFYFIFSFFFRYLDSELALNEQILKLKDLSTAPELYKDFVHLNGIPTLLSVLSHVNSDIAIVALDTLNDICDVEGGAGETEHKDMFVDALFANNMCEMVVNSMMSINEEASDEDAQGVANALSIIESMAELRPTCMGDFAAVPKFLPWLIKRIRAGANKMDENICFCSEILAIILQSLKK